ncbi:MAG: 3-oxoacyl-[acyl-carrier-protein] reductase [Clostridiales bacterium]|jgi:3-oxoacyl-[acyl-carrier protein] reductase|nr:3-oxoacyl-[acyl-carrier-protein] reductase [Clostridiales bacterium]
MLNNNCINLQDKVAIVTGGSRGIGASTAMHLARHGASVAIVYGADTSGANSTLDSIVANGGKAKIYQCDISCFGACQETIKTILNDWTRVDILVNNAGITRDKLILQMTEQDWDDVVDINLKGAFNTIKHLYPQFVKNRSGRIVNVSSISGLDGNAGQANYSSSKSGLIGLTKSIAKELGSRGITCNAVAPGFVATQMTDTLSQELKDKAIASIPLRRMGTVEDVANLIVFLASDKASYITGQVLRVDGGLTL